MNDDLYLVHKDALPDYFEQVLKAKELIEHKKVKGISEAVQLCGISRSTYYKYKDLIQRYSSQVSTKKAVISMTLTHRKGALSEVLNVLSNHHASVLTISQSLPVHGVASVLISLDITEMTVSAQELIFTIKANSGVQFADLVSLE